MSKYTTRFDQRATHLRVYEGGRLLQGSEVIDVIQQLEAKVAALEEVVNAVAHIGVDFGYGKYELEDIKIDKARKLMEGVK